MTSKEMRPEGSVVEYNYLGDSGLRVSNICLGCSMFGEQAHVPNRPASDEETSYALLDRFTELGGNFLDTSDKYSLGQSEAILGNWLHGKPRDEFVVATKVCMPMDMQNPNTVGLSRKHVTHSITHSLERLKTHFVDLYLMHYWDPKTPIEQTLRTMNDLVRCGKVNYVGVSNFTGWQLQKTIDVCKYMGLEKVVNIQSQYNMMERSVEYEVADVCRNEGVGLTPWCPLKGGWLAGKIKKGMKGMSEAPEGSRIAWTSASGNTNITCIPWEKYSNDDIVMNLIGKVEDMATKYNKSMAQISLRWLLQKDVVPSVVIGAKTLPQLEDNMGAARGWHISPEDMQVLDEFSATPLPETYFSAKIVNPYRY